MGRCIYSLYSFKSRSKQSRSSGRILSGTLLKEADLIEGSGLLKRGCILNIYYLNLKRQHDGENLRCIYLLRYFLDLLNSERRGLISLTMQKSGASLVEKVGSSISLFAFECFSY